MSSTHNQQPDGEGNCTIVYILFGYKGVVGILDQIRSQVIVAAFAAVDQKMAIVDWTNSTNIRSIDIDLLVAIIVAIVIDCFAPQLPPLVRDDVQRIAIIHVCLFGMQFLHDLTMHCKN
jgi:hypothetical protein